MKRNALLGFLGAVLLIFVLDNKDWLIDSMNSREVPVNQSQWIGLAVSEEAFSDNNEIANFPWPRSNSAVPRGKAPASVADALSVDYKENASFSVIRDPQVLDLLEASGYSLPSLLGSSQFRVKNSELSSRSTFYRSLVDILEHDLDQLLASEKKALGADAVGVGMKFARRIFDKRWLTSKFSKYELVGVINRLDRVSFDAHSCGETRFIYRLSYESGEVYSRLPLTVLVKYQNLGDADRNWQECKKIAHAWVYPSGLTKNAELGKWMISEQGPLSGHIFHKEAIKSVELNLQAMRIPSSIRPTLAGHGTYLLRVLKPAGDKLAETFLENTPDVEKIKKDSGLRKEFLEQFQDEDFVDRMSEGLLLLPEKFLATKAFSYSPYGIGRYDNRPYDHFLTEKDFDGVQFNQSQYVKSASAALKRLNDMSCVGCHQARAHAGFHFLGIDKSSTHPFNSMSFEGSGHFQIELVRRGKYLDRVLHNLVPEPRRDFSFAPPEGHKAKHGNFCGLPGGAFEHWQCDAGLVCQQLDEAEDERDLGKCFAEKAMAGDPVLVGKISQDSYHKDGLKVAKQKACGGGDQFDVFLNKGGFPGGQCYRKNCKDISPTSETELCSEAAGDGFNACLAKTAKGVETFESCLEKSLIHYGFGRCSEERPCRNDFVCARSFRGQGYCTPSYFLFQIRLDGHIDPLTGK